MCTSLPVSATTLIISSHLPSHTLIAKNLKPSVFNPSSIDKTYDTWRKGGNPSLRFIGQLSVFYSDLHD